MIKKISVFFILATFLVFAHLAFSGPSRSKSLKLRAPGCTSAAQCNDSLSCTTDSCFAGKCRHQVNGGFCSIGGVCYRDLQVNPANPCQECRSDWGANYQIEWAYDNSNACSDGNPCTRNDHCSSGRCVAVSYSCDDADACTTDSCNGDGTCAHRAVSSSSCPR